MECPFCRLNAEPPAVVPDEKGRSWHPECINLLCSLWKSPLVDDGNISVTIVRYNGENVRSCDIHPIPDEHIPRFVRILLEMRKGDAPSPVEPAPSSEIVGDQ